MDCGGVFAFYCRSQCGWLLFMFGFLFLHLFFLSLCTSKAIYDTKSASNRFTYASKKKIFDRKRKYTLLNDRFASNGTIIIGFEHRHLGFFIGLNDVCDSQLNVSILTHVKHQYWFCILLCVSRYFYILGHFKLNFLRLYKDFHFSFISILKCYIGTGIARI